MTVTYNDINYNNIVQGHEHFLQKKKLGQTYLAQYVISLRDPIYLLDPPLAHPQVFAFFLQNKGPPLTLLLAFMKPTLKYSPSACCCQWMVTFPITSEADDLASEVVASKINARSPGWAC